MQLKPNFSCRIHIAAAGGHKTALQLLLDMGADINEKDPVTYGSTALLGPIYNNHLLCVKLLIERGADVTALTNNSRTVLHSAAFAAFASHERVMKFLDDVVET